MTRQRAPQTRVAAGPVAQGGGAVAVPQVAPGVGNAAIGRLLRRAADGDGVPQISAEFVRALSTGSGQPIPAAHLSDLESAFGVPLDAVRLHTDDTAARLAEEVSARAFTVGGDIYFGAGQYAPDTPDGHRLLVHEVTHTLQPSGGSGPLTVSAPDSPAEAEAARVADALGGTPLATQAAGVHREPNYTPAGGSSQLPKGDKTVLQSSHADVGGKTVAQVATDLGGRDQRYRKLVDSMRRTSVATQQDEQDWYNNLGLMGGFIEWFNSTARTDPGRWSVILQRWDTTATAFDTALAHPAVISELSQGAKLSETATTQFRETMDLDQQCRAEFSNYLQGFSHAAEGVITVSTTVRDVAFAAAVAVAVTAAAPVVLAGMSAAGAGTLLSYAGTAGAMGILGAGMEGSGQLAATLGGQASMALADVVRGSERAGDNFNAAQLKQATWEGMERGFVDGVLALVGAEAEKVLASHVSGIARRVLGPANSGMYSLAIRRALTRAVSGGATGSVYGALQAGLRAAMNGRDQAGIIAEMKLGFEVGLAAGTALGAAGGVYEARSALQMREAAMPGLRQVAASGNNAQAEALYQGVMRDLKNNAGKGSNDRLAEVLPDVWKALRDPDRVGDALVEVWLEERLLGVTAPRAAADRYGAAAMQLSKRTGSKVIVLEASQQFDTTQFFDQVVTSGNRFLDLSAVANVGADHGAEIHLIQDLIADRALRGTGMRAEQMRQLFGEAFVPGRTLGNDIWIEFYDSFARGLNSPEAAYPVMIRGLRGIRSAPVAGTPGTP